MVAVKIAIFILKLKTRPLYFVQTNPVIFTQYRLELRYEYRFLGGLCHHHRRGKLKQQGLNCIFGLAKRVFAISFHSQLLICVHITLIQICWAVISYPQYLSPAQTIIQFALQFPNCFALKEILFCQLGPHCICLVI